MLALFIHGFFIFYLLRKLHHYTSIEGFNTHMRILLYWAYFGFVLLNFCTDTSYIRFFVLTHNTIISHLYHIFLVFFLFQTFETWLRTLYFYTIYWWDSTELESYNIYLNSIRKNNFTHMTKDEWFCTQVSKRASKSVTIFLTLIFFFIIFIYLFFIFLVFFAFKVDLEYLAIYISAYKTLFFYYLFLLYFFFLLLRSILNIPNSWLFQVFEFHVPGEHYDFLMKEYALYNLALESGDDDDYWQLCPFFLVLTEDGVLYEWLIDQLYFWPTLEYDFEWVGRYNISREWTNCKTIVFDCYSYNPTFYLFNKTKHFLGYFLGVRMRRDGYDTVEGWFVPELCFVEPKLKRYKTYSQFRLLKAMGEYLGFNVYVLIRQ